MAGLLAVSIALYYDSPPGAPPGNCKTCDVELEIQRKALSRTFLIRYKVFPSYNLSYMINDKQASLKSYIASPRDVLGNFQSFGT